ncbi:MAG: hypothetical protein KME22_16265 [Hassallia sp. WJT32-NPBG1]|jgi:hypothetical protein|nr:hypothetical protein [Hassallia sp. WJT32-NPBG1]
MAHSDAVPLVENLLVDLAATLTNEDEIITGLIADTNSFGWDLENFDI